MTTLLTSEEIRELKKLCSDPMRELGLMTRPEHMKCFQARTVTHSVTVEITFPEHNDAKAWNTMHQNRILRTGHAATVALTVLVTLALKNPKVAILTGSAAAIAKDEFQAKIWYPQVSRQWTLVRIYRFDYQQFPLQLLRVDWTDILRDEEGKEQERRKHGVSQFEVGGPNGRPEELVRDIMVRSPQYKQIQFKAGSIV
jgi:hypothetical protein